MYSDTTTVAIPAFIFLCTLWYLYSWLGRGKFNVPAVGPSAPVVSYWGALKFMTKGEEMLREGYTKYGGKPFRVANKRSWTIFISDPKLVDEVKKADSLGEELSFIEAVKETLETKYTFGIVNENDGYHIPVVRTMLTRNIGVLVDDVHDEIVQSFSDMVPVKDDWVHVPALQTIGPIIARTSGRAFVGLPLCRDPEFVDINLKYAVDVTTSGMLIGFLPEFLKAAAHRLISKTPRFLERTQMLLEPMIQERYQCMEQYGEGWTDKPVDLLQWLMEAAEGIERTPKALTARLLVVGLGAIHTTSMAFTQVLFRLAAFPEYIQPLREEIERIIAAEGLTKTSLQKMRKVDSFLKECLRMDGFTFVFHTHKALKDFTFSDGTFVPKGCYVASTSIGAHESTHYYSNPLEFNPWRFSDMSDDSATGEGTKQQLVNVSLDYLMFGLGRHACSGRFFAASVLKTLMVHLLSTYDIKMEKPGEIPAPMRFGSTRVPNGTATVMFRKRRV